MRALARFAPRPVSKTVYVFGEVVSPGSFTWEGRETVLDAIVAAGGLTRSADHAGIVLARPTAPCDPRFVVPICFDNIVQLVQHRETFSDPISGHGIHGRHNREYSARELKELVEGSGCRALDMKTIDVIPQGYSRDAEARGYGSYHMLRAVLGGEPRLFRPEWLYRGFTAEQLRNPGPLGAR